MNKIFLQFIRGEGDIIDTTEKKKG